MIIKTGYYDWNDFALKDSFYPDDIPEEWRLSFYANEIECAQICLAGLQKMEGFDELFDDLPEQFDLIVKCDALDQWSLLEDLLNNDDINIKTIVLNELCLQQWSDQLAKFSVPVCLLDEKQSLGLEIKIKPSKGSINIVYANEVQSLKQWRAFIDQWVAEDSAEEYYLLLRSDVYNSSLSAELRMMIEMMGY